MNYIGPILKQLFAVFPNTTVNEAAVAVYIRLLQDIPPTELQTVVDQAIAECKFLPSIAELRERYHALTRTLGTQSSAEAWGAVQSEVRRIGSWGAPKFDNPVTQFVVRSMGWQNICMSETPGVDRAQFERMYNAIVERGENVAKLLPQARDMAEAHQGTDGMKRIGDIVRTAMPTNGRALPGAINGATDLTQ